MLLVAAVEVESVVQGAVSSACWEQGTASERELAAPVEESVSQVQPQAEEESPVVVVVEAREWVPAVAAVESPPARWQVSS